MSFFKKLFQKEIIQKNENYKQHPQIKKAVENSETNSTLVKINQFIKGKGNDQFPFLSKEYSPNSRVPCCDFTELIIELKNNNDWNTIGYLLRQFVTANPGIAYSIDIKDFSIAKISPETNWIVKLSEEIRKIDFSKYIIADKKALDELIAMFLILSKKGGGREFFIFEEIELMQKALSIYEININAENISNLIAKANRFTGKMKKEVAGSLWDERENFNKSDFTYELKFLNNNRVANILKRFTVTERCAFFDTIESYYANNSEYFNIQNPTKYITRKYGANDYEISEKLYKSGLFTKPNNIELASESITKSIIKEHFENLGYELKKSWTAKKIVENILKTENGNSDLKTLVESQKIVSLNPDLKNDMDELKENMNKLKIVFELLCFV